MGNFLSCDWGTSSFRLRLIEAETLHLLAERKSDQGIAPTFSLWQQSGPQDSPNRASFYLTYVQEQIQQIENHLSLSLHGLPVIFSGMASSSIGFAEIPYSHLPLWTDGRDISTVSLEPTEEFPHPAFVISGIRSEDDVMRGEETQLIGVIAGLGARKEEQLFIFPGTHSKHIWVKDQQVVQFKTYMTGEFFDLLSKKSVLSSSVEENKEIANWESFNQGVKTALQSNLLNASFLVRTNGLFAKLNKEENYDFLSGLLIGSELKELLQQPLEKIYLCCGNHLKARYASALNLLDLKNVQVYSGEDIERAVIIGQHIIYQKTLNS